MDGEGGKRKGTNRLDSRSGASGGVDSLTQMFALHRATGRASIGRGSWRKVVRN